MIWVIGSVAALVSDLNSGSAPVIRVASTSSTPAILTHGFMPEPRQVRPPPPQLVLYSSGPPQTCSDQSPLAILTSPQCLEHPRVLGCQCRELRLPSKDSPSVAEPPWVMLGPSVIVKCLWIGPVFLTAVGLSQQTVLPAG
ncbi:hypothetical protein E4T56_gene18872 [Termitomyces sp. T112]|nr:hypothetical protein E4T56_gene18872 [Termitomyces sp. T112]